jgi:hypothetical protein
MPCFIYFKCSSCHGIIANGYEPFRKKYVCLNCNLCWKEKYDKYIKEYMELKDGYTKVVPLKIFDHNGARCKKCDQKPELVGDKFRSPKQNDIKEWNKIKKLSERDKKKLFADYCPKDSIKNRNNAKNYAKPSITMSTNQLVEEMYGIIP